MAHNGRVDFAKSLLCREQQEIGQHEKAGSEGEFRPSWYSQFIAQYSEGRGTEARIWNLAEAVLPNI